MVAWRKRFVDRREGSRMSWPVGRPEGGEMKSNEAQRDPSRLPELRRFLHDLSAPLSAAALHLEAASRRAARGDDPAEALETARRELARVFELFERGRAELLGEDSRT